MMTDDVPVHYCSVEEAVDLRTALAAAEIEYLDVDDQRTIVIYQQAILMVIATEGHATAAQAFSVEYWEKPPNPTTTPEDLLAAFLEELLSATDTSCV